MEQQIRDLVAIAKEYRDFGDRVLLGDNYHTCVRGKDAEPHYPKEGGNINIYFADNRKTCSIYLGDVEIKLYKNTLEIPFGLTTENSDSIIADAKDYLENVLKPKEKNILQVKEEDRLREIGHLEKKLDELKAML